ncbi:hypothetical protein B0H13DRAFT_2380843 [Mycena leptocephala]|nr:hypothetical protein B0H13DRAFT_2380843 [Mycena leptocephala]
MRCLGTRAGAWTREAPSIFPDFSAHLTPHLRPLIHQNVHLASVYRGLFELRTPTAPLFIPTLPRSPPNTFTRRVCLALCANIPQPDQRDDAISTAVLLSLSHSTLSPIHGPSLFTPYATPVAAAAAYLASVRYFCHLSRSNSSRVPSHCIPTAAQRQASPVTGVFLPRCLELNYWTRDQGYLTLLDDTFTHPLATPLRTHLDSSRQNAPSLLPPNACCNNASAAYPQTIQAFPPSFLLRAKGIQARSRRSIGASQSLRLPAAHVTSDTAHLPHVQGREPALPACSPPNGLARFLLFLVASLRVKDAPSNIPDA